MPRGVNNRTDLNLPKTAAPKQPYGTAKAQMDAQSAIPMGASPVLASPATAAAPAAAPQPAPGTLPWLHPTNRPDEPVTHGLPFGPGDGPEALAAPQRSIADQLGATPGQSPVLDA